MHRFLHKTLRSLLKSTGPLISIGCFDTRIFNTFGSFENIGYGGSSYYSISVSVAFKCFSGLSAISDIWESCLIVVLSSSGRLCSAVPNVASWTTAAFLSYRSFCSVSSLDTTAYTGSSSSVPSYTSSSSTFFSSCMVFWSMNFIKFAIVLA